MSKRLIAMFGCLGLMTGIYIHYILWPQKHPVVRLTSQHTVQPSEPEPTTTSATTQPPAIGTPKMIHRAVPVVRRTTTTTVFTAEHEGMADPVNWASVLQLAEFKVGTRPAYAHDKSASAQVVSDWAKQAGIKNWKSELTAQFLANDSLKNGSATNIAKPGAMLFYSSYGTDRVTSVEIVESVKGDDLTTIGLDDTGFVRVIPRAVNNTNIVGYSTFP